VAPSTITNTSKGTAVPAVAVPDKQTDEASKNVSTPTEDVLDAAAAAPQMITTPALTKEKRAVLEANAEGVLEDSDCEESMLSMKNKRPRAARKLSMNNDEDGE